MYLETSCYFTILNLELTVEACPNTEHTPGLSHSMSGYWEGGFSKNSDESSAGNSGSSHRHPLDTHSACEVQKNTGNGKYTKYKYKDAWCGLIGSSYKIHIYIHGSI